MYHHKAISCCVLLFSRMATAAIPSRIIPASPFRCPLTLDTDGYYTTSIQVPSADVENHVVRIAMSTEIVLTARPLVEGRDENSVIRLTHSNPSARFIANPLYYGAGGESYLGVGYGGEFLNQFGSVAIIRNYTNNSFAEMFGNSRLDIFREACIPDSFVEIPAEEGFPRMSVWFGESRAVISRSTEIIHSNRNVLEVPRASLERIIAMIRGAGLGLEPVEDLWPVDVVFTNCTRDAVPAGIPNIYLELTNGNRLSLIPEDYIEITPDLESRRQCRLKIGISGDSELSFSPLLVRGLNYRLCSITRTIQFCDSNRE